jgi:uncharacterized protein
MTPVTVIKRDLEGRETWRYSGTILRREAEYVLLEARFNRPDLPFHGITLGKDDRFVETFYNDRWYNIFEIHDRLDDRLKVWYCNVGFPAEIGEETISYIDLALDLLVYPDGRQLVLDEDEFDRLPLTDEIRWQSKTALGELQGIFSARFHGGAVDISR